MCLKWRINKHKQVYICKNEDFCHFIPTMSTPALDLVHRLTLLNNCKLHVHVRTHELCVLIMKQVTAVRLQNGLRCTV